MKENNFDLLRFFFAFVVVLGHMTILSKSTVLHTLSPYFSTYLSVTAFFCISGYLITSSYLNTPSIKRYFIKRAARLLPAYIFVILICAILLSFTSSYSISGYFRNEQFYKYLFANLTFLNFLAPSLPGVFLQHGIANPVNGALWTLKVEVAFYLLLPAIIYFIQRFKRKYIPILIIYSISLIYQFSFDWYFERTGNQIYNLISHQLPAYLTYFGSGIALYYYYDIFIKHKTKLFILGFIFYFLEHKIGIQFFTPFALSLMVFAFAYSLKSLNSFAKHGDLSYGIYIYHYPIISMAVYFNLFNQYNPFLIALITILIILIISYLSWHLLEKKVLGRVHQAIPRTIG